MFYTQESGTSAGSARSSGGGGGPPSHKLHGDPASSYQSPSPMNNRSPFLPALTPGSISNTHSPSHSSLSHSHLDPPRSQIASSQKTTSSGFQPSASFTPPSFHNNGHMATDSPVIRTGVSHIGNGVGSSPQPFMPPPLYTSESFRSAHFHGHGSHSGHSHEEPSLSHSISLASPPSESKGHSHSHAATFAQHQPHYRAPEETQRRRITWTPGDSGSGGGVYEHGQILSYSPSKKRLSVDNYWPPTSQDQLREAKKARGRWGRWRTTLSNVVRYRAHRDARKLALLILLNVAYSSIEFFIGLFTGRIGLVSDSFHLSFGCGVLLLSLYSMVHARQKGDDAYTYGYERLEVLSAFTNALFLLFLSFSLSVEALHAFIEDESEHRHYLVASATANLLVNLLGVFFFRRHARFRMLYRRPQDLNHHSIFLHVLSDSIRSAGVILASWLLAVGVQGAETICLGLVAALVLSITLPLFKASGGVLLQMAPAGIPASALAKCLREAVMCEGVLEVLDQRFWAMVPGSVVGTLAILVKEGADQQRILQHVHSVFNDLGVTDLTVQLENQR